MKVKLCNLECPFNWNVPEIEDKLKFLNDLKNKDNQVNFLMDGITVKLLEIFEKTRCGGVKTTSKLMKELKTELMEYNPSGELEAEYKYLLDRTKEGIWHVILSTEAHLARMMNDSENVEEIIPAIEPYDLLDESNKAAILGIKCRFFMEYGPFNTTEIAIKAIKKAVLLDNSVILWKFYLGKALARHRRANTAFDPPSKEEIAMLEEAFKNPSPHRGVLLLHSYSSLYYQVNQSKQGKNISCKSDIENKIKHIYKYITNNKNDQWYVYWRCATIAMNLPNYLINAKDIKFLIDCAVKCSNKIKNTNMYPLYEAQCKYYSKYDKNYDLALYFANEASKEGFMGSSIKVIKLNFWKDKYTDLIPIIDRFIEQYKSNDKKMYTFIIIKADYLMMKNKVHDAMRIYLRTMETDCKMYQILNWMGQFNEGKGNLYHRLDTKLNELISTCKDSQLKIVFKAYLDKIKYYEENSKK